MNILVSTLGLTPEIIEETIGFCNWAAKDFYAGSEFLPQARAARREAGIEAADELWLVATDQPAANGRPSVRRKFDDIKTNCAPYGAKIRLFLLAGVPDITNRDEAEAFHDLTLRVVAAAKNRVGDGKLYLSLACGRKTMSAAMQDAAHCFGCDQLVHILGDSPAKAQPVLLGPVAANPALRDFPRKAPVFADAETATCSPDTAYFQAVQDQKRRSQHFLTNYYLKEEETRANFHILYTLPPEKIEALKAERIGLDPARREAELQWLARLPKADLHCHLGGALSPAEMIEVARAYEPELAEAARRSPAFAAWRAELEPFAATPPGGWKTWRKSEAKRLGAPETLIAPALLLSYRDAPDALDRLIYGPYREEGAFRGIGLAAYEALGDLQGSALLGGEAALREAMRFFLRRCAAENLYYLELRCSPLNYASADFPADRVSRRILEELQSAKTVASSVLLIATRRGGPEDIERNIAASMNLVNAMRDDPLFAERFRGFDLAGNERIRPEMLRPHFLPIMADCRNITIHAGETENAESVWEAVYHLNAERIGHGLTLREHPELMDKFLERGIGVEMCPSSNFQIRGFRDNYFPADGGEEYPLKQYLDRELKVSVNTDDPGISRTTITNELHRAARLTPGGLSKWDILQLVCNGFRTAFYPYDKKKALIRRVEEKLGDLIERGEL